MRTCCPVPEASCCYHMFPYTPGPGAPQCLALPWTRLAQLTSLAST